MMIASVDPGGNTGLIEFKMSPFSTVNAGRIWGKSESPAHLLVKDALGTDRLTMYDIGGTEIEQAQRLYRMLRTFDVVIIEDWQVPARTTSRKRETLSPVRIGFGLELLLTMSPAFNGRIVFQQPTQLSVITDQRLRQWGLWMPGKAAKDRRAAMKHLLIYLRGNRNG